MSNLIKLQEIKTIPAIITDEVIIKQLDAKLKSAGFNNHAITNIQR